MIAAPKLENGITLNIQDELVSKPYIDATITAMKKFGVNVETVIPYQKYMIPAQSYKPTTFTVPSDFSSISLLLSAAVLLGENLTIQMTYGRYATSG